MNTAGRAPGFRFFVATTSLCAIVSVLAADLVRGEGANADTSAWSRSDHSGLRLLSGNEASRGAIVSAGVEIALSPGWKTYWRYPGDSGVPPRFDFSASDNVASVKVMYPAPKRFTDGGGTSLGYADNVILPVQVTVKDPSKPVTLRAHVEYAICEKLCVPVDAKAALGLAPASASTHARLKTAIARVPQSTMLGRSEAFAIVSAKQVSGAKARVVVDVRAPNGKVDLFAEGPTGEWSLPLPQPIDGAPDGLQRFSFELDGLPSGVAAKGATLTLTATAEGSAIEAPFTLD